MADRSLVGETIAGYKLESVIGRGGMGVVYLAQHERLQRKAAVKVLSQDIVSDPAFRERFVRESKLAASLDHPNVIPIYDAGEADGVLYLAMRYVRGFDLQTTIARSGRLEPGRVVSVVGQVAGALDAAHARGLIHRDVKPANVLLTTDEGGKEHAYLVDFGLARDSAYAALTQTGQMIGTIDYVAPEVIEGRPVTELVDVYALACTAYESLTGEPPYRRESQIATLWAHVNSTTPDAHEVQPEVPERLSAVVARGMAKDPNDRFPSAGALAASMVSALGASAFPAISAEAPATTTTAAHSSRRNGALLAGSAALVALLLIGAFLFRDMVGGSGATSAAPTSVPTQDTGVTGGQPTTLATVLPPATPTGAAPTPTAVLLQPPSVTFRDSEQVSTDPAYAPVSFGWATSVPVLGWTFQVESSFDGVLWTPMSGDPTDVDLRIRDSEFDGKYLFRVAATDTFGQPAPPSPVLGLLLVGYQETNADQTETTGAWSEPGEGLFGTTINSSDEGASVSTYIPSAHSVGWVADMVPGGGTVDIYLNEELVGSFTLDGDQNSSIVYASPWLDEPAETTLRIVITDPGPGVRHDAFLVSHPYVP